MVGVCSTTDVDVLGVVCDVADVKSVVDVVCCVVRLVAEIVVCGWCMIF